MSRTVRGMEKREPAKDRVVHRSRHRARVLWPASGVSANRSLVRVAVGCVVLEIGNSAFNGYGRCSSLGGMDGDGPIRQRTAIQKFADEHGIEIVSFYEESHTGSDLEGRTEFKQMRSLLVSNGVRLVIVEKLDRLARSIMVQETILADFKKHDIELKSATPGEDDLCGEDPTRTLIRQILGCFFEYERKMIESKLRAARQRMKVQKGKCEGQKAFGTLPGESGILKRIILRSEEKTSE